ncbi:hypothetical protein E2C01_079149 [Portunus trituberculatus]|uniref:Secreted protein n=1 Tax=Portunus trituberculatus TaxID=210409 RepID=A0A5B7IG80_PORTR|nr:hypothetical protein [Portunus trituberculatus]
MRETFLLVLSFYSVFVSRCHGTWNRARCLEVKRAVPMCDNLRAFLSRARLCSVVMLCQRTVVGDYWMRI